MIKKLTKHGDMGRTSGHTGVRTHSAVSHSSSAGSAIHSSPIHVNRAQVPA